jgi:hypothetical protein
LQRFPKFSTWLLCRLNMSQTFSRPSSGPQQLQEQSLVLQLECGDSSAVGRGRAGRPARPRPTAQNIFTFFLQLTWKNVFLPYLRNFHILAYSIKLTDFSCNKNLKTYINCAHMCLFSSWEQTFLKECKRNATLSLKFTSPCIFVQLKKKKKTRCNNFSSLLLDVYVQLNIFRASSRPSSGAQQLQ